MNTCPVPKTAVSGSNPADGELPDGVVSIGSASAAIVSRLMAMRDQRNARLERSA